VPRSRTRPHNLDADGTSLSFALEPLAPVAELGDYVVIARSRSGAAGEGSRVENITPHRGPFADPRALIEQPRAILNFSRADVPPERRERARARQRLHRSAEGIAIAGAASYRAEAACDPILAAR